MKNYIVESVGEIPRVRDVTFCGDLRSAPGSVLLNPSPHFNCPEFFSLSLFSSTDFNMPYYRRPYKRARGGKKIKYSVQQKAFAFNAEAGGSTSQVIVPPTTLEGMRKVKHLTVNLTSTAFSTFYWVIAYVPQGTTAAAINLTSTAGMYEPNQFVLNCGIIDTNAGPIRLSTPLARNLNDGDAIYLIVLPNTGSNVSIYGTVRYAISLQ